MANYITTMATSTTIQISSELREELQRLKVHEKESYEDIIWDLIEDRMELSEEILQELEEASEDIRTGRVIPFALVKEELDL